MCGTDCFLLLLAVLFPPIGVWVKRGICSADSLINIALCCLGFLPGLLHAWYIILQYPDPSYEGVQDSERAADGSVTYYYVSRPAPQHPAAGGGRGGQGGGAQNYGTLEGNQPFGGQFPGLQQGGIPGRKVVYAQQGGAANGGGHGEGSATGASAPSGPPPTYADVIKGDNKIQTP